MEDGQRARLEGGRRLREGARRAPPLVSIVTVVFRAAAELPPLLESIEANRGEDTEWIVIDGGSEDGTVGYLRRFDAAIDYWLSEPDEGIYDAMNKGVRAANGAYILHLNAGDRLLRIPRQELVTCLADKVDLAAFAVNMEGFGLHWPRPGLFLARFAMPWHHQGAFYMREGHLGYDTQFRVHADFDLNQRMVLAGKSVRCFKEVLVSKMGAGGISRGRHYHEQYRLVRRNFGLIYVCICFFFIRVERFIPRLKKLRARLKGASG